MAESISLPLKGKVAVVTGASRGIGAAVARTFAQHGCSHIAITYVSSQDRAEAVLADIRSHSAGIKTLAIQGDVLDNGFGPKVVAAALRGLNVDRIDIVVNNAAPLDTANFRKVADLTHDYFQEQMTGLIWSQLALARAAVEHMSSGGRIINISSGSAIVPMGDPTVAYAIGKAGLEAASRQLATLYGPKGVTVNSVSVGATETDSFAKAESLFGSGFKDIAAQMSLLKRVGTVEEVASIIAFIASPQGGWITGNVIPANGGALAMAQ